MPTNGPRSTYRYTLLLLFASGLAGVEVFRKVVQYALARPCREVLFTVVSRNEKYTAKVSGGNCTLPL